MTNKLFPKTPPFSLKEQDLIKELYKIGHGAPSIAIILRLSGSRIYSFLVKENLIRTKKEAAFLGIKAKVKRDKEFDYDYEFKKAITS